VPSICLPGLTRPRSNRSFQHASLTFRAVDGWLSMLLHLPDQPALAQRADNHDPCRPPQPSNHRPGWAKCRYQAHIRLDASQLASENEPLLPASPSPVTRVVHLEDELSQSVRLGQPRPSSAQRPWTVPLLASPPTPPRPRSPRRLWPAAAADHVSEHSQDRARRKAVIMQPWAKKKKRPPNGTGGEDEQQQRSQRR
jgi:hypothetical protein